MAATLLLRGLLVGDGLGEVLKVSKLLAHSLSSSEAESGVPSVKNCRMLASVLVDLSDGVVGGDSSAAGGLSFLGRPLLRGGSLGSRGSAARVRFTRASFSATATQQSLSVGLKGVSTSMESSGKHWCHCGQQVEQRFIIRLVMCD